MTLCTIDPEDTGEVVPYDELFTGAADTQPVPQPEAAAYGIWRQAEPIARPSYRARYTHRGRHRASSRWPLYAGLLTSGALIAIAVGLAVTR